MPEEQLDFLCPQAHERLEDAKLEAVRDNNVELVSEILDDIDGLSTQDSNAAELSRILKEPHFQVRFKQSRRRDGGGNGERWGRVSH